MPEPVLPPGYTQSPSGLLLPTDLQASHFGERTDTEQPSPWLIDWAGGPEAIRDKLIARIPLSADVGKQDIR